MEKKGFIERVCVERDARLKKIILTEKGISFHQQNVQKMDELEMTMRERLSDQEIETFFRIVRIMRENLEKKHCETDRRREQC